MLAASTSEHPEPVTTDHQKLCRYGRDATATEYPVLIAAEPDGNHDSTSSAARLAMSHPRNQ